MAGVLPGPSAWTPSAGTNPHRDAAAGRLDVGEHQERTAKRARTGDGNTGLALKVPAQSILSICIVAVRSHGATPQVVHPRQESHMSGKKVE